MDTARYILATLSVVAYPATLLFWLIVHGFIGFWRKLGPGWTYAVVLALLAGPMTALYLARAPLLAVEFGTGPALWLAAALSYSISVVIEVRCRKHLKFKTLVGVPELGREGKGGRLITEGIYSKIRHPRYVSVWFGTLAVAFLTNYLALYVIAVLVIPALYIVVLLEERELRARFGSEYADYSERVPRFFPRSAR